MGGVRFSGSSSNSFINRCGRAGRVKWGCWWLGLTVIEPSLGVLQSSDSSPFVPSAESWYISPSGLASSIKSQSDLSTAMDSGRAVLSDKAPARDWRTPPQLTHREYRLVRSLRGVKGALEIDLIHLCFNNSSAVGRCRIVDSTCQRCLMMWILRPNLSSCFKIE